MSDNESEKHIERQENPLGTSVEDTIKKLERALTKRGEIIRWLRRVSFISPDDLVKYNISRRQLNRAESGQASIKSTLKVIDCIRRLSPYTSPRIETSSDTINHIMELAKNGEDSVVVDGNVFLSFDVAQRTANGVVHIKVWCGRSMDCEFFVRKRSGVIPTPYHVINFILAHYCIPASFTRYAVHQINKYL